jgi:hypothetical protein
MRVLVLERIADGDRRRQLLEHLAEWAWLDHLRRDGRDAVRDAMRRLVP